MAYVPFLAQKIRTSAESQDPKDTQTGTALPGVRLHSFRKSRVWLWYNCSLKQGLEFIPRARLSYTAVSFSVSYLTLQDQQLMLLN